MATKDEVIAAVAAEKAEVQTALAAQDAKIQALQDQINAGGTVTAADLDDVKAAVEGIYNPAV